jgi:hypothetical protein
MGADHRRRTHQPSGLHLRVDFQDSRFEVRIVSFGNACVSTLLRSPFHRLLSGSTDLIRYRGRRTGREITMPTQYAECGSDVVILAGRPETKTWWKNFRTERDLDLLIRGRWSPMLRPLLSEPTTRPRSARCSTPT